jgi:predicted dehydrogenase
MKYRIAFCGLGSIARRHLKNLCTFLEDRDDSYEIDLYRSSLKTLPDDIQPLVAKEYLFTEPVQKAYDVVFVTNPTSMHYETLKKFKEHTKSIFIEKPVFDSTEVDESIFEELKGIDCYVACPLRYNPVLQYVKDKINLDEVFAARAISSSYLPEWRPGLDYRQCYSAHRDMGGGVGIDLIHEWDYLTNFFGMPDKCYSIQGKISNLEIDSDDIAIYIAKVGNKTIELHLDYFGRKATRILELYTADDTIKCDILSGFVTYQKKGECIILDAERNAFQMLEIEHFFDIIEHKIPNDSTAEHAYAVLKLAKEL